ncbi:hypothetical protein [Streptomyces sp. NPDC001139]
MEETQVESVEIVYTDVQEDIDYWDVDEVAALVPNHNETVI